MTCIAALRIKGKGCYMAADRRASYSGEGSWFGELRDPKIRERFIDTTATKVLYATRGTVAFGNVLDVIQWPDTGDLEPEEYIVQKIWPQVRKGLEEIKFDPQKAHRSEALICIEDCIFTLTATGCIVNHGDEFVACGDGASAAYGAYDMFCDIAQTQREKEYPPSILNRVLIVTARRNWSCGDKVDVLSTFKE